MSCSSSSSSSQDEDKTPTAFAKQLYTLLDNDRQNVDRDSKYTAFWVALGMTLSSQYRQVRPHCLLTVCVSQYCRSLDIGSRACCLLRATSAQNCPSSNAQDNTAKGTTPAPH